MKRFNRWFAAPMVFGALVVFSGCFAQTEPAPGDEKADNNENLGEVQDAFIGQTCTTRSSGSTCTGFNPGTCCETAPPAPAGICRNLQNDRVNCGACGHVCGTGACSDVCLAGVCGKIAC